MTQWPVDAIIEESEVAGWKGWTRIKNKNNGSRRYRSPGGSLISMNEWTRVSKKYESQGYVPESDLNPIGDSAKPSFFTADQVAAAPASLKTSHPESRIPPPPKQATVESDRGVTPD